MSAPSLTKHNPDPHCCWFPTSNGLAWFKATDQQATGARQVVARSPFRSSNPTANASGQGPTTAPAAPANSHNPHRCGQIPIEPVAPPAFNFPRFRALALFGRLPSQRVDPSVIQASEKPAQQQSSLVSPTGATLNCPPSILQGHNME
jgi:hypothetical protein